MKTKVLPKPKAPRELTAEQRAEQAIRFTGRNPGEVAAIFADCKARLEAARNIKQWDTVTRAYMTTTELAKLQEQRLYARGKHP